MSRTVIINGREYPEFRFAWEVGPLEPSGARPFRAALPVLQPRTSLGYGLLGTVAPPPARRRASVTLTYHDGRTEEVFAVESSEPHGGITLIGPGQPGVSGVRYVVRGST